MAATPKTHLPYLLLLFPHWRKAFQAGEARVQRTVDRPRIPIDLVKFRRVLTRPLLHRPLVRECKAKAPVLFFLGRVRLQLCPSFSQSLCAFSNRYFLARQSSRRSDTDDCYLVLPLPLFVICHSFVCSKLAANYGL